MARLPEAEGVIPFGFQGKLKIAAQCVIGRVVQRLSLHRKKRLPI